MIVAAAILGSMIVWMAKNRNIADELKKANDALSGDNVGYGICPCFCFCFQRKY